MGFLSINGDNSAAAKARLVASGIFTPRSISGLALWLDGSDTSSLYTTDAGPVVPVTLPTEIAGCVGWWDGADATSMFDATSGGSQVAPGGVISRWQDKSGRNNHATATTTARPTLTSNGLNGKSVVTFDGSANAMTVPANADFNSNDLTYFVVFRQTSTANKGVYTKLNATGGTLGFGLAVRSDPSVWVLQKNAGSPQVLTASVNPTTATRIYTVTSTTAANGFLDGLASVSATGQTADHSLNQAVTIGARAGSEFLNGYIAEIIHFNVALSTTDRARVEAYLAAKWGITGVHRAARDEITAVNAPTDLAGCAGWWDCSRTDKMFNATSGGSLVANGGTVLRLEDLSGNGKHLVQASSSVAPTRQDAGRNGLPCLNFAGTRTVTAGSAGDWNFLHNANGGTVFAVLKPFGSADPQTFAYGVATNYGGGSAGIGWSSFFDDRSSGYSRNNHVSHSIMGGVSGQPVMSQEQNNALTVANDYSLFSFVPFAGASTTAARGGLYISGTAIGGTNSSTLSPSNSNSSNALIVGASGGNSIDGLAELVVFNCPLSTTDRARVEKYLANKWGIASVPDPTPPVGYWADKSGNARHVTQATGASRPVVGTTGGRKSLTYDGVDDVLSADMLPSALCSTAGGVAFYVAVPNNDGGWAAFTNSGPVGHIDRFTDGASYHGNFRNTRFSGINAGAYATTGAQLIVSRTSAATGLHTVRKDGATIYSAAEGIVGYRGLVATALVNVGSAVNAISPSVVRAHFIAGAVPEVVCYQSPLTDEQVRRIERYLAAKWGITLAPTVSNADAQDWINRVYANGGTVSASTAAAVNTFCNAIDAAGIRNRFYRLNLFCGGGLNACLVPIYRGPSLGGTQFGNTVDINNGPFVSNEYVETGASGGLGTTLAGRSLSTGFQPLASGSAISAYGHLAVWAMNRPASRLSIAGVFATNAIARIQLDNLSTMWGGWNRGATIESVATGTGSNPALFAVGRRSSNNSDFGNVNGSDLSVVASTAADAATNEMTLFHANSTGIAIRLGGYSVGAEMSASQMASLYTIWRGFQNTLQREVP